MNRFVLYGGTFVLLFFTTIAIVSFSFRSHTPVDLIDLNPDNALPPSISVERDGRDPFLHYIDRPVSQQLLAIEGYMFDRAYMIYACPAYGIEEQALVMTVRTHDVPDNNALRLRDLANLVQAWEPFIASDLGHIIYLDSNLDFTHATPVFNEVPNTKYFTSLTVFDEQPKQFTYTLFGNILAVSGSITCMDALRETVAGD